MKKTIILIMFALLITPMLVKAGCCCPGYNCAERTCFSEDIASGCANCSCAKPEFTTIGITILALAAIGGGVIYKVKKKK